MRATPSSAASSSTTSISPLHSASGAGVGNGAGPFLGVYCGRVPAAGEDHSPNFRPDGGAPAPRRTPVIVVFGLKPERIVGAEGRIDAVPEPPSQEQAGLLVEAISSGIEAGGTVVAIVPEWFPPEGLQRLEMARALLDTERVAIHVTPLPPLAATALASPASSLAPRLPSAGLLASVLDGLSEQLHSITWLGSVAGLKRPVPSLGQHIASLTPGSAFGVSSFPEPAVHRLRPGEATVPLPPIARPSRLVVAGRPGGEADWLPGPVNQALGSLPVVRVDATPHGPMYWSTAKLAEGVVCPLDADALAGELISAVEAWACRWCGELIARSPCPLCGHRARPRRVQRPQQGART